MPHRKISGSPALIPLRGPGQQPRSQPQTVAFLPTSTAAHPPPPHTPAPSAFSLLGPTKEAHIPQLFGRLKSWLKFTPWESQRGGWLLLECVWLGPSVPTQTAGSAGAVKRADGQGNRESPAPSFAREWNVLLWVLKQTQPRKGSGGCWELAELGGAPATRLPLFPWRLSTLR